MPDANEYLATALRRDDPTLAPPCCAKLEKKYLHLMTDPLIKFFPSEGVIKRGNSLLARFRNWQIQGGLNWQLPHDIYQELILEKNPIELLEEVGERNGITVINNTLWAMSLHINGNYEIRRPVRQSHLAQGTSNLYDAFITIRSRLLITSAT